MAREADVCSYGTTQIAVPPGATNAVLVIPPGGQVTSMIKYASGSSLLYIVGVPEGVTYTGAQLVTALSGGWLVGPSEIDMENGPVRYYLMATGATAVCSQIIGFSKAPLNSALT